MTDLQNLIGLRKGSRSYEQLSVACGGVPTRNRLHAMAKDGIKNFPDPETIKGLSRGLQVTEMTVVLAAAQSLGLDVRPPSSWAAFLPAGTDEIPEHMRDGILAVIHSAVRMTRTGEVVVSDGKPQPWRQEAQQAGSAPNTIAEVDSGDEALDGPLTQERVQEERWAAHTVDLGDVETSEYEENSDNSPGS